MSNEPLPLAYAVETESADRRHVRRVMAWTLIGYAACKGLPLVRYAIQAAGRLNSPAGAWPLIQEAPMIGLLLTGWALMGFGAVWLLRGDGTEPRAAVRVGLALSFAGGAVSLVRILANSVGSFTGSLWAMQFLSMLSFYTPDALPLAFSFALPRLRPRAGG